MAKLPPNWNQMSYEDKALWEHLNAGEEFVAGGAPVYESGSPLSLEQLAAYEQLGPSALGDVTTDTKYREYEMEALRQLEEQSQKGFSARDEADLARVQQGASRANKGRQGAIQQNMQSRGLAGSGLEFAMAQQAAQDAAEMEALAGLEKNAQMMERKQSAAQRLGSLGSELQQRDFSQEARKAEAADAIARFNTANTIQRQQANTNIANEAAQQNWGRGNQTSDRNTASQYDFRKDQLGVKQGGAQMQYNKAVDDYNRKEMEKQRKRQRNAGVGSMLGGVAGAAIGTLAAPGVGTAAGYQIGSSIGGNVGGFANGGRVPGVAPFPGDDPRNDIYTAQVSADEIIIPRTAADDPAEAAAFAAQAAASPFSSIKNPKVRAYMEQKFAANQELDKAQKSQDMLGYANLAGKAFTDFGNSQKEDVFLKNRMQDLGRAPDVVEAKRTQWDGSMLDKLGTIGVDRAKGKMSRAQAEFDESVKLDKYSREEDAFTQSEAQRKVMQNPESEESAAARDYLRTVAPGVADKLPNFESLSAAQIEKVAPGLYKKYELDRKMSNEAADRASRERMTSMTVNKPSAAQTKAQGAVRSAEAARALRQDTYKQIEDAYKGAMTGPVMGRVGGAINKMGFSAGEATDTLNVKTGKMMADYIKEISGATVPEEEMKRLSALMPGASDSPDLFNTKMAILKDEVDATVNKLRIEAGLDPISTKAGASGDWSTPPSDSKPSWAK